MANEAWNRRREAARKYKPNRIRLLLVAESPPQSKDGYFYFEDGASVDDLFEAVCEVLFEEKGRSDKTPYLKELRRRGIFLVELKPDAPRRGEKLGEYVPPFLLNLEPLAPEHILLISADVYEAAHAKLKKAGLPVVDARIPAPSKAQEANFRREFRAALVKAGLEKMIRALPARKKTAGND